LPVEKRPVYAAFLNFSSKMTPKRAVFGPKTGNALPVLDKIFFEMDSK
jgi:hypothetical protein